MSLVTPEPEGAMQGEIGGLDLGVPAPPPSHARAARYYTVAERAR